ncbi:MAG: hypothetical protein K2M68_05185, partial [Muribaculaceae bacterium]|nr:hypothetical protein [Muribaculaceae bacterium]
MTVIALVVLTIIAVYLPPVQDFALKKALTAVNSDPNGMQISVGRARLYPPLHLEVDDVTVSEASDTMAVVDNADLRVSLWPLMKGAVGINELSLTGVQFNMAGNDTTMSLDSHVGRLYMADATVGLGSHDVDIDLIMLGGTRVDIAMPDSTTTPADTTTTSPLPWRLNLKQFRIDSLTYSMTMPGTIDTLAANIGAALIENTAVDLSKQAVDVKSMIVEHLSALYLTPPIGSAPEKTTTEAADTAAIASEPWTVNVAHIDLKADSALYGVSGARPQPGLDMNYLAVTDVNIVIDSLMNRGTDLRVPIKRIAADERCGIDLRLSGLFTMNSDSMAARDINLGTLYSGIKLNAMMGMKNTGMPMPLQVKGHGYLSPNDIRLAMPAMTPMLAGIPSGSNLDIDIDIEGQDGVYDINDLSLELPRCFNLDATGYVAGAPDIDRMDGRVNLSGHMAGGRWLRPTLTAAKLDKTVTVQPLTLKGSINFNRGTITGGLNATTMKGKLAMNASWTGRSESYTAQIKAAELPVEAFMPALGVENITADVTVKGKGYNPMDSTTTINADVRLLDVTYMKRRYTDIELLANVAKGDATVTATSGNAALQFDIRARGNLATTPYVWTVNADIDRVDLKAMGITDSVMNGSVKFNGNASIYPAPASAITAALNVESLEWNMAGGASMSTTDMRLHFISNDSLTSATVKNHDLDIALTSPTDLDSIMS